MNITTPKYSEEYLDSVQERFWELKNHTTPELIDVLERNEKRISYEYEYQVDNALHEIEQEAILDGDDELIDYLFGDMTHEYSEKIQNGINYVIQHGWRGDLVLWSRLKDPIAWIGPSTKIGSPGNIDDFHFIHSSEQNFVHEDKINMLLLLSINKTWENDSLWRNKYTLTSQLLEISPKNRALLPGMLYKKDLDAVEFQEHFEKIQA